jgi:hypothetical protein
VVAPESLRRWLRLVLVLLLVAWLFSPLEIRESVPFWLPFLVALALELNFFLGARNESQPRSSVHSPQAADQERYGDGTVADWVIVDDPAGRRWVDASQVEDDDGGAIRAAEGERFGDVRTAPFEPQWQRRAWRGYLGTAGVLAVVALAVVLVELRGGGWESLSQQTRQAAEARFTQEAGRIAGHPVEIECDTSGSRVGFVQHSDGLAEVGGRNAYLTPEVCYRLHRLAVDGETDSFSGTARAIAVLAHEAWHLRGEADEGVTECFALQSGVELGQRLGLSEGTARRMMRSQLVENSGRSAATAEYRVPADCENGGPLDLRPNDPDFP